MTNGRGRRGAVLIGFMGSGKTVVGRELARRLGIAFIDVDRRIEEKAGKTVREIFASEGEAAFRERERAAIREAAAVPGRILAPGGGAFVDAENRRILKEYAPVVFLEASPETVVARLSRDRSRPLLAEGDRERRIRELLSERTPSYREADFTVSTDGRTVEQVADRIAGLLSRMEGGETP